MLSMLQENCGRCCDYCYECGCCGCDCTCCDRNCCVIFLATYVGFSGALYLPIWCCNVGWQRNVYTLKVKDSLELNKDIVLDAGDTTEQTAIV